MSDKTETRILFWGGLTYFVGGLVTGAVGVAIGGLVIVVYAILRGYKGESEG